MRVGLFDSGIGGLTVLNTLLKKYPYNEYVYYGDTLNVPYGNKSKEELLDLAKKNIEFLISKNVDFIIVACGTVSSNCLDYLKEKYSIPIISVISPTIEYLNNSNYSNILVIATNATINSHIFKNNINKNIYEVATPKLVNIIESGNYEELDGVLHEYLDEYKDKVDAIILGCTHYPIIKDYISNIINCDIIDMSEYIEIEEGTSKSLEIYFSKLDDNIKKNASLIINK